MRIPQHEEFILAIHEKRLIEVKFFSKTGQGYLMRKCAPMDYGPWDRKKDDFTNHYHFWDFHSPSGPHPLSLLGNYIEELRFLEETFDPSSFAKWFPLSWHVPRDWDECS